MVEYYLIYKVYPNMFSFRAADQKFVVVQKGELFYITTECGNITYSGETNFGACPQRDIKSIEQFIKNTPHALGMVVNIKLYFHETFYSKSFNIILTRVEEVDELTQLKQLVKTQAQELTQLNHELKECRIELAGLKNPVGPSRYCVSLSRSFPYVTVCSSYNDKLLLNYFKNNFINFVVQRGIRISKECTQQLSLCTTVHDFFREFAKQYNIHCLMTLDVWIECLHALSMRITKIQFKQPITLSYGWEHYIETETFEYIEFVPTDKKGSIVEDDEFATLREHYHIGGEWYCIYE